MQGNLGALMQADDEALAVAENALQLALNLVREVRSDRQLVGTIANERPVSDIAVRSQKNLKKKSRPKAKERAATPVQGNSARSIPRMVQKPRKSARASNRDELQAPRKDSVSSQGLPRELAPGRGVEWNRLLFIREKVTERCSNEFDAPKLEKLVVSVAYSLGVSKEELGRAHGVSMEIVHEWLLQARRMTEHEILTVAMVREFKALEKAGTD